MRLSPRHHALVPPPDLPRFSGDAWATGKWGRADATGVFARLRRESGLNCVRFAVQARYVKPTLEAAVSAGFDLPGPKFCTATHSAATTYADVLDACRRNRYEPVLTLLTSEELRPTGNGSLPGYLGRPRGRYRVPVPKTLTELRAWETFCREVADSVESRWPRVVRRYEVWNGFQRHGTPAGFARIVRHAAAGVKSIVPAARILVNPASPLPPADPNRWERFRHVVQHCADCLSGVAFQTPQARPAAEDWPIAVRRSAEELGAPEDFEVWETRWRLPGCNSDAHTNQDPVRFIASQVPRGLTGILHAHVFGFARDKNEQTAALLQFANDDDRPRQLSDRFVAAHPLYSAWCGFNGMIRSRR